MVWCAAFGVVHVFWALGGETGLASSAGARLATTRPASFVVFGLWGVAVILTGGALLAGRAVWCALGARWLRVLRAVAAVIGIVLVLRGVLVETALAADLDR